MKRLIKLTSALLLTFSFGLSTAYAQAPEKMSYQAVVRNSTNNLVTNTNVGMQISILQGSATGTAVYVETQNPTTNANGLVTIEIGTGTVVSGDFTTIDWANGPYFIKTETDPAGGTNYTITGTTQLMSVPYALHAKTADSISGGIIETDPVFGASIANGITAVDTANWNNHTVDTDTHIDSTGIAGLGFVAGMTQVTAGTNITVTGTGTTASPYVVNATGTTPFAIGQSYQGGIIFWLDATGQHGLIAATTDQSTGIQWYNGTSRNTGTSGDGLFTGVMNTTIIVATQIADNQTGNFAAKVCADYSVTNGGVTYGDWYLPSKYELNLLYLQKTAIGGFASGYYWSSTENNSGNAWGQQFSNGYQNNFLGKNNTYYVRAIRAF